MPSKAETVLLALQSRIAAGLPLGAKLLRNCAVPERIPAAGLLILHDGEPGEPETLLSPPLYYFEHRAELDILVEEKSAAGRDAAFDNLRLAVGLAIAADRTLGGTCDYVLANQPAPSNLPVDGGDGLKAATIPIMLAYATPDPLL